MGTHTHLVLKSILGRHNLHPRLPPTRGKQLIHVSTVTPLCQIRVEDSPLGRRFPPFHSRPGSLIPQVPLGKDCRSSRSRICRSSMWLGVVRSMRGTYSVFPRLRWVWTSKSKYTRNTLTGAEDLGDQHARVHLPTLHAQIAAHGFTPTKEGSGNNLRCYCLRCRLL